jgi:capsular exopolysaccharide synthesis family protein
MLSRFNKKFFPKKWITTNSEFSRGVNQVSTLLFDVSGQAIITATIQVELAVSDNQNSYLVEAIMHYAPALNHNHHSVQRFYSPGVRQVFMGIYNHILLTATDNRQQNFLICSANPGEGSTTMAIGIAFAAAEIQNQPVLLIDGNFSHPQVCATFGLPELYGFGDLLAGRIEAQSVVQATPMPLLKVMGAGVPPVNHVGLLESPACKHLLERLNRDYATIIIDGPAINLYPESVLYASQVDRAFLVVHAGITRVQVVETALARLDAGGSNQVEVVLNRRTFPIPPWIYKRL